MRKILAVLLLLPVLAFAGEPPAATSKEINHLLSYLKESGCQFNRNGSWYSPAEAVDHLNQKYQYLLKKGMVDTAEDFIARAASESSMSGKSYQVQCGKQAAEPSGPWLKAELMRYRGKQK